MLKFPDPEKVNLLPHRGEVYYFNDLFSEKEACEFFAELHRSIPWKQLPIKIFGKEILQPRLTAWFADAGVNYAYSGLTLTAVTWTPLLLEIKRRVEQVSGSTFNSALLNLYRDGNDSMGWHRDNEKELGRNPVIASVSFGETRKFQLREYAGKNNILSFDLAPGSLLLMSGESQHYWEHRLPKTTKVLSPRINLTFRRVHK